MQAKRSRASLICGWMAATAWRGQGCRLGPEDLGMERGASSASQKARPKGGAYEVGEGVGQRRRGARLGEAVAAWRLSGFAEALGG